MSTQQKTVLLIEDDPIQQDMYGLAFQNAGIKCLRALDQPDGLKIARDEKPDLILLDLLLGFPVPAGETSENGLEKMIFGGIEVLKEIKKDKDIALIPVVILTNYTKRKVLDEVMNLGAKEIVVKIDVTPKQLVEMMKKTYLK
jgi:CheY-like chemotaxis protein